MPTGSHEALPSLTLLRSTPPLEQQMFFQLCPVSQQLPSDCHMQAQEHRALFQLPVHLLMLKENTITESSHRSILRLHLLQTSS